VAAFPALWRTRRFLQQRVGALETERNARRATIDWQFTSRHARVTLKRLYLVPPTLPRDEE